MMNPDDAFDEIGARAVQAHRHVIALCQLDHPNAMRAAKARLDYMSTMSSSEIVEALSTAVAAIDQLLIGHDRDDWIADYVANLNAIEAAAGDD